MSASDWKTRCSCGNDLTVKFSVCRNYVTKDENKYPNSHCYGHYKRGLFEPDTYPDYPLEHHDLVDGSDTCTLCRKIVG